MLGRRSVHRSPLKPAMTRRDFLCTGAAAGAGLVIGLTLPSAEMRASQTGAFQPNAWLQIDTQDNITIWVAKSEMGQGVRTSLPMLVAEELEAASAPSPPR